MQRNSAITGLFAHARELEFRNLLLNRVSVALQFPHRGRRGPVSFVQIDLQNFLEVAVSSFFMPSL